LSEERFNYDYAFFESIFQYRFIHADGSDQTDTSTWKPINGSTLASSYNGIGERTNLFEQHIQLYSSSERQKRAAMAPARLDYGIRMIQGESMVGRDSPF
jgi:hypothetical protein